MLGIVYTVISSAFFGVTTVVLRRGVTSGSPIAGLIITVLGGVPLFLFASVMTGQLSHLAMIPPMGYIGLSVAGVIHILIGRYCVFKAYAEIGANRTAPVVQGTALLSVLFALAFLGEEMTLLKATGVALVLLGPALAAAPSRTQHSRAGAADDGELLGRTIHGYGFAALGTVMFGISPILIRFALEDSGGLGILGGLVSYGAAAALLIPFALTSGQLRSAIRLDRTTQAWFAFGGFTIFLGHMFRFLALSVAPVSIVVPLLRSQTLFAVALGYLVNRQYESFHPKTIGGIAIALAGSVVLVA